jgi:ribose 5-phosphate isomerase B
MKVIIASDHAGFKLKEKIKRYLANNTELQVEDYGAYSEDRVDYPDYGSRAARDVANGIADRAILICKTGIGMSIIANRYKKIRAALCCNKEMVLMSRRHNDANVLVLPAILYENSDDVFELIDLWFHTEFEGGRHIARVHKLDELAP